MCEPCSPGRHNRSFTGVSGQMREKYTALWPEPVMRATLVSSDSLRRTPTSARAGEHARQASRMASAMAQRVPAVRNRSEAASVKSVGLAASNMLTETSLLFRDRRTLGMRGGAIRSEIRLNAGVSVPWTVQASRRHEHMNRACPCSSHSKGETLLALLTYRNAKTSKWLVL